MEASVAHNYERGLDGRDEKWTLARQASNPVGGSLPVTQPAGYVVYAMLPGKEDELKQDQDDNEPSF